MKRPLATVGLALVTLFSNGQEVCDNAIDDDSDGLVDLNDTTDCVCTGAYGNGTDVESIIPNPSFEDYDCLPTWYSQLDCADTWAQATYSTSDYFYNGSYMPYWIPQPLPSGGNACVGGYICPDYMEYIGTCLLQPMVAGTSYTINLSIAGVMQTNDLADTVLNTLSNVDITLWGYDQCPTWPINASLCPEPEGWTVLATVNYDPSGAWTPVAMTFTPTYDVQAVMIGSPCTPPADYPSVFNQDLGYFLYDDLTMNESSFFSSIDVTGGICTEDLVLHGTPDTLATSFQWYYEGVAIGGQNDSLLAVSTLGLDTGWYQFMGILDTACAVTSYHLLPPDYPAPSLSAAPLAGCAPLDVAFSHGTDPALTASVEWDFGDSSPTSADEAPDHTYTDTGTYDVTLTVTSPEGCVADTTYLDLITVHPLPIASFTATPVEGCTGMTVDFTNTSVNSADCAWTFGDPPTSNVCDPSHTYNLAGTYDVSLNVISADGCVDDTLMVQLITVYDAPAVDFTSDTIAGCTPLTIAFTNNTPPDQIGTVEWDLGNETVTDQDNPVTVYNEPGQYTVSLVVTHPQGCVDTLVITDMITAYGHPVVSFTNEPDSGCYPLEVFFSNTTDPAFTGTCSWAFGDGGTASTCDVSYVYAGAGVYSVSLEVISPQNCQGDTTYPDLITVFDHPTAEFTFGPQPTDYFDTYISFVDASSVDVIQWDWSFGVGGTLGTSTDEFPALHFPSEDLGTYPVQLIVTNVHTCTDTALHEVVIDGYYTVYVPNTFTPDGDGVNDQWRPMIKDQFYKDYQLRVFDRWGEEIWASTDPNESWDGKLGGEFAMDGVYAWRLDARDVIIGHRHEYYGHVTLLK